MWSLNASLRQEQLETNLKIISKLHIAKEATEGGLASYTCSSGNLTTYTYTRNQTCAGLNLSEGVLVYLARLVSKIIPTVQIWVGRIQTHTNSKVHSDLGCHEQDN